jgi:hypothetical protein
MNNIKDISVRLKAKNKHRVGMDDHLFVGVFGKGRGCELPFELSGCSDFETEAEVKCRFGDAREDSALTDTKKPYKANKWDDSGNLNIDLDKVNRVYLRKHSKGGSSDYDVWKLNEAEVTLYGSNSSQKRTFHKTEDIWLAIEHGLKVWLKEE